MKVTIFGVILICIFAEQSLGSFCDKVGNNAKKMAAKGLNAKDSKGGKDAKAKTISIIPDPVVITHPEPTIDKSINPPNIDYNKWILIVAFLRAFIKENDARAIEAAFVGIDLAGLSLMHNINRQFQDDCIADWDELLPTEHTRRKAFEIVRDQFNIRFNNIEEIVKADKTSVKKMKFIHQTNAIGFTAFVNSIEMNGEATQAEFNELAKKKNLSVEEAKYRYLINLFYEYQNIKMKHPELLSADKVHY